MTSPWRALARRPGNWLVVVDVVVAAAAATSLLHEHIYTRALEQRGGNRSALVREIEDFYARGYYLRAISERDRAAGLIGA